MKTLILLLLFVPLLTATSYGQLKADFSVSQRSGCVPVIIQFQDKSTGNPSQWKWYLGNGTSTLQNPQALYDKPGTYTVKLVVVNNTGTDSIEYVNYITIYENPLARFNAVNTSGCAPWNVQFTDQSSAGSGIITERVWDFGDGSISSEINPTHTYTIGGNFGVTLTLKNSYGCKTFIYKDSTVRIPPLAMPAFDYSTTNDCVAPTTIKFINQTEAIATSSFRWNFGDGQSSTSPNPSHVYNAAGDYIIQLTSTNAYGCTDSISKQISIGTVKADFSAPDTICIDYPVSFLNTSSPLPSSVEWDFGDGGTSNDQDATHTFTKAGTYQIQMTGVFGTCSDVATKTVTILDKPIPSFTITGNARSCALPQAVSFNNTTINASSYKWLFGDGDSSQEASPAHTYSKEGSYTVTLIAFNESGCSDTIKVRNAIQLGAPKITGFEGLPASGCAPVTINPHPIINSPETVASYLWDFGDGTTSTDSVPTHTYNTRETYSVSLSIKTTSGCTDSMMLTDAVGVGSFPKGDFTATPLSTCASTGIQFTTTSDSATSWNWIFGDGLEGTGQNPFHKFKDTGYFTIQLVLSNNGCSDTITKENFIYIKPPVAKFNKKVDCNNSFSYHFIDTSIDAEAWSWDMGDGTTFNTKNAAHIFASPGTYIVKLTVTNGECSSTQADTINVVNENPLLTYDKQDKLCKYDSVNFQVSNYKPEAVSAFTWVFGDGKTDATLAPSIMHKYNQSGTYLPSLVISFINGCIDTITIPTTVKVEGPTANFSAVKGSCINGTITFTDLSTTDGTHPITQWVWDFGNDTSVTYTAPPFNHTYSEAGVYDVKLVVYDSYGCKDSINKDTVVRITKPVADFSALDSIRCSSSEVSFKNNSIGLSLQYFWNFGDGNNSYDSVPTHVYTSEGMYTVNLLVKDVFGCKDSITKLNYITVANPVASFTLSDTFGICPPLLTQIANFSKNYTSLYWDFGDGNNSDLEAPLHYYNMGGRFDLTLIAKGHGECYDTAHRIVLLNGPSGSFDLSPENGCNPTIISGVASAKNTIKYAWDFNNGVIVTSKDSTVSYTYTAPGVYLPKLLLSDTSGCEVSIPAKDSIIIADVVAIIKATPQTSCDSSQVLFEDSSIVYNDKINSYQWDFGNGTTSSSPNPTKYYTKPGTYTTSLIVTTSLGCTDTMHLPLTVNVNPSPKLIITSVDSSCLASPVNFKGGFVADTVDRSSMQWTWNFGDGSTDSNRNTSYTYNNGGDYKVVLTATDKYNCTGTTEKIIAVIPPPAVNAGNDTAICLGSSIKLNPSGAFNYIWLNDASLGCNRCANPRATPSVSTTYYVTGKGVLGCTAQDSVFVEVKQPINLSVKTADTICAGSSVQITASGAEIYNWQPAAGLNNNTIQNPVASPNTTTTYTLIGTDDKNCFSDTTMVKVEVFPVPQFNIVDTAITINLGAKDTLETTSSPDITAWGWTPSLGLSCNNCPQPVAQPPSTITYTANVVNAGGCTASDQITVKVLCNGSNVFVPNTFSPNNDGMNDVFYPRGVGPVRVRGFRIFNRWGSLLFERNNFDLNDPSTGWKGDYKGKPVDAGVYVYVLDLICDNQTVFPMKGNVTLLK